MEPLIREEGGHIRGQKLGIIVCELSDGKMVDPVVLLVVDVDAQVLFEDLVDTFGLPVRFGVVCH